MTDTTAFTAKLGWFGTGRARAGFVAKNMLFYATGGLAYGRVSVSGNNTSTASADNSSNTIVTPFSYAKTKLGWAAGGGIEAATSEGSRFTVKLEYLHLDLGSIGARSFGSTPAVAVNAGRFTDEIFRVGFNFRL